MENSGQAPQKTKNTNAYDPAIPLLRSYQKEMKSADKKYIFILVIIHKSQNRKSAYMPTNM